MQGRESFRVVIGSVDVSNFVEHIQVNQQLNNLTVATVELVNAASLPSQVDYTPLVRILVRTDRDSADAIHTPVAGDDGFEIFEDEHLLFTGTVEKAETNARGASARCVAAIGELTDTLINELSSNLAAPELLYTIARTAGMPTTKLRIAGLDSIQHEAVEIVAPVEGVTVDGLTMCGKSVLVPADAPQIRRFLQDFKISEESSAILEVKCFAISTIYAQYLLDAEEEGLANIDEALSWLSVRAFDCRGVLSGRWVDFHRDNTLAVPRRRDRVMVRGLVSGRQWLRAPSQVLRVTEVELADLSPLTEPQLPADLPETDRQAIAAWRRARLASDPVISVLAIWEAIEFYVSTQRGTGLFEPRQKKAILRVINKTGGLDLSREQKARICDMVGQLNSPSMMMKLRTAIAADGAPVSDDDVLTLKHLREARNDAAHGNTTELSDDLVRQGLSIVARLLVERLRKLQSKGQ